MSYRSITDHEWWPWILPLMFNNKNGEHKGRLELKRDTPKDTVYRLGRDVRTDCPRCHNTVSPFRGYSFSPSCEMGENWDRDKDFGCSRSHATEKEVDVIRALVLGKTPPAKQQDLFGLRQGVHDGRR